MRAFVCRLKPDGKTDITDQALQESRIYYGLPDIPGLADPSHTLESIRLEIAAIHPEYKPLREAKMFWTFSRTMQPGDLILVPKRLPKQQHVSYFVARAVGAVYEVPEYAEDYTMYRRKVLWLNDKQALHRDRLPKELIDKIIQPYNVQLTCLDVSEFAHDVDALVGRQSDASMP